MVRHVDAVATNELASTSSAPMPQGLQLPCELALEDLRLDTLTVYYPGHRRYALSERIEVVPIFTFAGPAGSL